MSTPKTSSSVMREFWNCAPSPCGHIQEGGEDAEEPRTNRSRRTVRSFVDGFLSPFVACVQPPLKTCGVPRNGRWDPHGNRTTSPFHEPIEVPLTPNMSREIEKPHENDILCGRGGSSVRHPGNQHFRELIAANKAMYTTLTKKQKMLLARQIVETVHQTQPSGRFLARDCNTGRWHEIGIPRSLEKTSQALREKASNSMDVDEEMSLSPIPTGTSNKADPRNLSSPTLIIPSHLQHIYRCSGIQIPDSELNTYNISSYQTPQRPIFRSTPYTTAPVDFFRTPSRIDPQVISPPQIFRDTSAQAGKDFDESPSSILQRSYSFDIHALPSQPSLDSYEPLSEVHMPSFTNDESDSESGVPKRQRLRSPGFDEQFSLPDLVSPSGMLQARSSRRRQTGELDGLAALSTAAFLRLDETD